MHPPIPFSEEDITASRVGAHNVKAVKTKSSMNEMQQRAVAERQSHPAPLQTSRTFRGRLQVFPDVFGANKER